MIPMYSFTTRSTGTHARRRGFSLVEVLVYCAVTVLIATASVVTFLSLQTVLARTATLRVVTADATISLERMVRDARAAHAIDTAQSTFGTQLGVLALDQGTSTVVYQVVGGRLTMMRDGVTVGQLTSPSVAVNGFTVTRFSGSGGELVRVALTLTATSSVASTTRTWYMSAVPRGIYD